VGATPSKQKKMLYTFGALGIGVSMNSQAFKKQLQGSKPIRSQSSLYHWKNLLDVDV
jgi:hypothetical protein